MERRQFIRNALITTGSIMLGSTAIYHFFDKKKPDATTLPPTIENVHEGNNKKVLVLMSAGTRLGNTDQLTDAYIRGAVKGGHSVKKVYLGSMRMEGCRGCGACQHHHNQCVVQDDMQKLYSLFAECDTLVMASPLYFWTITSRLKAFIERLYAISVNDKYPQKETVLLMTAGDDNETTFDQPVRYFHLISEVLGANEKGIYCAGDCTGCEKTERHIDAKHLENAYQMGLKL